MANKMLNLLVRFTGVDNISDAMRNIMMGSRHSAEAMKELRNASRDTEKELKRVRREMENGGGSADLIRRERELAERLERTNQELARRRRYIERVNAIQMRAGNISRMATSAGTAASVAFTASAGLVLASVDKLAERSKAMQNAANVAGMGGEQFQRNAHAARSVGVEFDKYGDILKDTQDKIGEFTATGGGEMSDFFKNIAPKVGVTAKSFKDLSGADALQLYYNSLAKAGAGQKEMLSYMEAIADEGSGLIPLLASNGRAMQELGSHASIISASEAATLQKYTEKQIELTSATQDLTLALAESGLIDTMTWLTEKGTKAANWFGTLTPDVRKFAVTMGLVAAVGGPILIVLGMIASAVAFLAPILVFVGSVIGAVLGTLSLPFLAVAAAIVGAGVIIYANWDKIKGWLSAGITWLKGAFSALPGWMNSIGGMMMQGLLMSLNPALLVGKLIGIAKSGVTAFKNYFGIKSPSRLFMEMGGHINEGLGIGIDKGRGRPIRAIGRMAGAVAGAGAMALSPAMAAPSAQSGGAPAKIEIHIHQMPGEDTEALAQRVAQLVERAQQQNGRRGYGDDF